MRKCNWCEEEALPNSCLCEECERQDEADTRAVIHLQALHEAKKTMRETENERDG